LRISGLMPRTLQLQETRREVVNLTQEQYLSLRKVGQELRGQASFWPVSDEETLKDRIQDGDEPAELDETSGAGVISVEHVRADSYYLTVLNAVGVIALPDLTLHILPKIPLNHFSYLAGWSLSNPRIGNDKVSVDSLDMFREVVANWCVGSVEDLFRSGLLADYRETREQLPIVRGRINVRGTTNHFLRGQLVADCTFDEFDLDHPLNRVLRAAVRSIAGSKLYVNTELRRRAARMDRALEGIGPLRTSDRYSQLDRRTARYRDAFDLSLRVLTYVGTNVLSGNQHGRTFLVPTPDLMEKAIRNLLKLSLSNIHVDKKGKNMVGDRHFSINPDLVFNHGRVVGDVKYKVASNDWARSDVSQAALFATGYSAHAALICSFATQTDVIDMSMLLGKLPLARILWNATDDVEPSDAGANFIARVAAFLESHVIASVAA